MEAITEVCTWFWPVALGLSTYQDIRGAMEHWHVGTYRTKLMKVKGRRKPESVAVPFLQWLLLAGLHDFIYRFVCCLSGFVALAFALHIAASGPQDGAAWAAAAGLFAVAIPGIGGQLAWLLLQGKASVLKG